MCTLGRVAITVLAVLGLCVPGAWGAVHPQDGPHADLRYRIEPEGVSLSAGFNLAFIDQFVPFSREALGAVSSTEAAAIEAAYEQVIAEANLVRFNDVPVRPVVKSVTLHADPDPKMAALYPRMGMRALIRAVAMIEYPRPGAQREIGLPERVEIGWDLYPVDELAKVIEPESPGVKMFLDAQLRAAGTTQLVRFSEPAPTVTWIASEAGRGPQFADVPRPPRDLAEDAEPAGSPGTIAMIGALVVAGLCGVLLLSSRTRAVAGVPLGGVALAAVGIAIGVRPASNQSPGAIALQRPGDDELASVARALHVNLYRAFDYTDESEIYDALARSMHGPAHERLYNDVFASLVQADQGGELGIVTGLDQLGTTVDAARWQQHRQFAATQRWRVQGTVYHMGHSHTVRHEYEGVFTITAVDDAWRITDYQLTWQQRLDVDQPGVGASPASGEL